MMSTAPVAEGDFVEGTITLGDPDQSWFCLAHETRVKAGKECLFCLHEQVGDEMFASYGSGIV
jgi:hypothetical protein